MSYEFNYIIDKIYDSYFHRDIERHSINNEISLFSESGFGSIQLNQKIGYVDFFDTIISLSKADSNIAHVFRNHFSFVDRYFLRAKGNPDLEEIERAIRSGKILGIAKTEVGHFNDGSDINTTVTTGGDGALYLNGKKYYATGSLHADYLQIKARLAHDNSVVNAIVPSSRAGVIVEDDWDGFGQRLSASGTVILADAVLHPNEIFDEAKNERKVYHASSFPQLYLTAIIAGIVQRIEAEAISLLRERKNSFYYIGDAPKDDAIYQKVIGELSAHAEAAVAIIRNSAALLEKATVSGSKDDAVAAAVSAARAKISIDRAGLQAASLFFDVLGASATIRTRGYDAFWRNIRTLASHNPADQKAKIIGDHLINEATLPDSGYF